MNKNEIGEIRRRINAEKLVTDCIHGCYVNEKGEVITTFEKSMVTMPTEECDKYLAIFRKVMSGAPGKGLLEINFAPDVVMEGEQHRLLMAMRGTALKVEDSLNRFYERLISVLNLEGRYVILLLHDTYDVRSKFRDDNYDEGGSESSFPYFLCAICPVKETKPELSYSTDDRSFCQAERVDVIAAPELGFMFPSYEDGGANIYSMQYYTKDPAETHEELIEGLFEAGAPMPAAVQKETFDSILSDTLGTDCDLEVVQSVREHLLGVIEDKKQEKSPELPTVSKKEVGMVLSACGVAPEHVQAFEERYDEEFGIGTDLSAVNLSGPKSFEVRTPDVVVKVNPERSDLVETRVIDGTRYIMIRAEENVEVNGVSISIGALGEDVE